VTPAPDNDDPTPHTTVSDTTTGPWRPIRSPSSENPDPPPLTVVHDTHDDHAFMTAALAAHTPALGRITVHPTPATRAPAALAHDLLRSLDKHLPLTGSEEGTHWTGRTDTAWRAVAAWIRTLHIGHVIVTRTHHISPRHLEHLLALRELTGVRLTLLCHGPLPPALAALPHHQTHTLTGARLAVSAPAPPPPAGRYPWWQASRQFPPREDEPCFLLPTRRPIGRRQLDAAARHLGRTMLPLPTGGQFPSKPDHPTTLLAHRLHVRVAHPFHTAALATRILTGRPTTQQQQPATRMHRDRDLPIPLWAADLIAAARHFGHLEGRPPDPRPPRPRGWDTVAVSEAARACGLFEPQQPSADSPPHPTP
jgi:hypothetical protein